MINKEMTTDDFVFKGNKRLKDETFEDYRKRLKVEKLQLKILDRYGRRQWPGSKGTLRKVRG